MAGVSAHKTVSPISARRGRRNVQTNYRCSREEGYTSAFHRVRHVKRCSRPVGSRPVAVTVSFIVAAKTIGATSPAGLRD
jgi:hypothetical protein